MRISSIAPAPTPTPTALTSRFSPAKGEVALLDLHGVGFFSLRDSLTGYGRPQGYASLANARRAAALLSRGEESPAAGVFQQGNAYYVRAFSMVPATSPHAGAGDAARGPQQILHFEGNAAAHFAWVRDSRLVLLVDGTTKIWSRDAHHKPPLS